MIDLSLLSVAGLKILNFVIGLLPDFSIDIPAIDNISQVVNIFAWINFFLPTSLIAALLGIITAYYSFKLIFNIIMSTKDILL